jgi:aspartyl protease family protein
LPKAVPIKINGEASWAVDRSMSDNRNGLHVNNSSRLYISSVATIAGSIIAACLGFGVPTAQATDVAVVGLFPSKAVIVVNGAAPRTVAIGQRLVEGVVLTAVTNETATLEIDGVSRVLRMGQHFAAQRASDTNKVVLAAGSGGHFFADGTINGGATRFLVDTGATTIAISTADAKRLGINYLNAPRVGVQTANGTAIAYQVRLDTVAIGGLAMGNVDAMVLERGLSTPLLGMSFLSRTNMQRDGDTLTLIKRF